MTWNAQPNLLLEKLSISALITCTSSILGSLKRNCSIHIVWQKKVSMTWNAQPNLLLEKIINISIDYLYIFNLGGVCRGIAQSRLGRGSLLLWSQHPWSCLQWSDIHLHSSLLDHCRQQMNSFCTAFKSKGSKFYYTWHIDIRNIV